MTKEEKLKELQDAGAGLRAAHEFALRAEAIETEAHLLIALGENRDTTLSISIATELRWLSDQTRESKT